MRALCRAEEIRVEIEIPVLVVGARNPVDFITTRRDETDLLAELVVLLVLGLYGAGYPYPAVTRTSSQSAT